jgi:cysteine desulfurase
MSKKITSKLGKKTCPNPIYFDNNATTLICEPAKKVHAEWLSCYNASSDSKISKPARNLLESAKDIVLSQCNVSSATHTALFTSGATESNCFIIRSCVKAYKKKLLENNSELLPHVIISSTEHHSSMECVKDLKDIGDIEVSYINPTIFGNILPEDVEKEIKSNTCLITIMFANNEVPIINNIEEIGKVAHKHRVPLHSDCVQIFGKYKIDVNKNSIDALSASAHKFYGPKGVGLLIINNKLIEGYNLTAEISGSQQKGLRGGTENIAGIASMIAALKWAFVNRKKKNQRLFELRDYFIECLNKKFKIGDYLKYIKEQESESLEIVLLGPPNDKKGFILPNTVLLSVCKNKGRPFCNVELKKYLDSKNCIVSIGSSCLTKSDKASHVLSAISAPPVIKRGVIRISFNDYNTYGEIDKFINILEIGIIKQCFDIKKEITEEMEKKSSKKKNDKKIEIKSSDDELNDLDD